MKGRSSSIGRRRITSSYRPYVTQRKYTISLIQIPHRQTRRLTSRMRALINPSNPCVLSSVTAGAPLTPPPRSKSNVSSSREFLGRARAVDSPRRAQSLGATLAASKEAISEARVARRRECAEVSSMGENCFFGWLGRKGRERRGKAYHR